MMNVISVNQFDKKALNDLFVKTLDFKKKYQTKEGREELLRLQPGKQMCSFFFEASTRTRVSFELAAQRIGMGVVSTADASLSSVKKGETLEDTITLLSNYGFDLIVMRHNETGAAERAAKVSKVPIINGGDGKGEHPTQALLDMYTIWEKFGRLDNLTVSIGGDLANGRTARSLAKILSIYEGNKIYFVSSNELRMGDDIKEALKQAGTQFEETENMNEALSKSNVIYWTRIQKERMENPDAIGQRYIIDENTLKIIPTDAIIMHPLPRVDEITVGVDSDKRAYYFIQAANGLYLRMALIDMVLNGEI
jgi:aspartate carbamoyltransferase catalytic subunit